MKRFEGVVFEMLALQQEEAQEFKCSSFEIKT
jgi:hypothetical protein